MDLSVFIADSGYGCPNYFSIYQSGVNIWVLWKIPAVLDSAEDATT